jgi:pSer/pThr/pTyr-binding forkhead associated (FHA) protein
VVAVVLGRSDDAAEREEYVLIRRHATVGASPQAAIVITGPGVARLHARLIAKAGVFFIEDLGSADGTWVNQRRVLPDELVPLQYGDSIILGRVPVAFEPFVQQFGGSDS